MTRKSIRPWIWLAILAALMTLVDLGGVWYAMWASR
jgi:hypothetical protein